MTNNINKSPQNEKNIKKKFFLEDILSGLAVATFALLFIGALVGIFLIGLNADTWIFPRLNFPVPTQLQEAFGLLCLIFAVFLDVVILAKLLKTSLITLD